MIALKLGNFYLGIPFKFIFLAAFLLPSGKLEASVTDETFQTDQLELEQEQFQTQQLEHCRFLYLSPSITTSPVGSERNVHVFVSASGRFASPSITAIASNSRQLLLQPSRVCEFAFIGSPTEKVDITFTDFDFPGHPPQCKKAYLDIVFQSDVAEFKNFVELNHENRFCGKDIINVPHRLVSLHQSIFMLMDTSAMKNNTDGWRGFRGTFAFIPARPYHIGTPLPASASGSSLASASMSPCGGQLIRSNMTPIGVILSPNYPGLYGDDSYCFWRLVGSPGERIKLTFNDFGLFYGDDQCPFDFVNVFDGFNSWSPQLRTLCGQLRDGDVVLFSRGYELFIEFATGRGRYDSRTYGGLPYWMPRDDYTNKRRGFKATFEFSTRIVPLTNILGANAAHIAGTECDQLIQSNNGRSASIMDKSTELGVNKQLNGVISPSSIFSPYYPMDAPENTTCVYHFQGRSERDYIDKIRLLIIDFGEGGGEAILNDNIVVNPQTSCYAADANTAAIDPALAENRTASYLISFYSTGLSSLSGVKMADKGLCLNQKKFSSGSRVTLKPGIIIESIGPNLTITFTSLPWTRDIKRRFLMQYTFVRDFHVATAGVGKQIADYVCHFVFNSSNYANALTKPETSSSDDYGQHHQSEQFVSFFTSPHFPRPYPTPMRCVYDFIIDRRKYSQLRIWFDLFDVGESASFQQSERLEKCRDHDHVSVFQLLPSPRMSDAEQATDRALGSYSSISFSPSQSPVLHSVLCGRYLPGPLVSDPESNGFQVVFTSGSKKSTASNSHSFDFRGFRANFEFLPMKAAASKSDAVLNNTNAASIMECPSKQIVVGRKGAITSPNHPNTFYPAHGLICDWTIQAFTEHARLQLMLTEFELEGAYNPSVSLENCQNAAIEIYTSANLDQPNIVRCSSSSILTGEIFLSQGNKARIRFLTSLASTGGPGFRIDWNEVYDVNETECLRTPMTRLWCNSASRCINADLRCDGIHHCGLLDPTDENNCNPPQANSASLVLIIAGGTAAILSLVIILLVVLCRLRRQNVHHCQLEKDGVITPNESSPEQQKSPFVKEPNSLRKSGNRNHQQHFESVERRVALLNKTTNGVPQSNQLSYQKDMEETILIDTESRNGGATMMTMGSSKKLQLFEKITIV